MTSNIYLSLGSNTGDKNEMIGKAVAAITESFKYFDSVVKVSTPFVGPAEGFESGNKFVNVGVLVNIRRTGQWTPLKLEIALGILQAVERTLSKMPHRNPDGTYRDREIDIDLIAVDNIAYCSPSLEIPHPRMAMRRFVLMPMMQLMPDWHHPLTGLTPAQMLDSIDEAQK